MPYKGESGGQDGLPSPPIKERTDSEVPPTTRRKCELALFPALRRTSRSVRFFGRGGQYERVAELGLHDDLIEPLEKLLSETAGAILVSRAGGQRQEQRPSMPASASYPHEPPERRSTVTLEDPIEVAVPGVAQSQVNAAAGLDLATGLRFLMRQDPEVIMVGEIRDRATAEAAMQASLTGHLLLSTFHAGSAVETLGRLLDMGIEPYVLRSGLLAIVCQRLLRRLCACPAAITDPQDFLGLKITRGYRPGGCRVRRQRVSGADSLAEMLSLKPAAKRRLSGAVLARADTTVLGPLAVKVRA